MRLIHGKLDEKSKLLLDKNSLPVESKEVQSLNVMSENLCASQSGVDSCSGSQAGVR